MTVKRCLMERLAPFLKRKEYISIIGPRQVGKTTFLGMLRSYLKDETGVAENHVQLITFEERKLLMEFESDPAAFVRSYMKTGSKETFYLMIDEFQYAQEGGQKLKLIYDTINGLKIVITGSSSLDIRARVGKFMVGRILNFYLYPFNLRECLRARDSRLETAYAENSEKVTNFLLTGGNFKQKHGQDILHREFLREHERLSVWGGYPAAVLTDSDVERRKALSDAYNNFVLKDIKTLLDLATEKNLFLLSRYLATQIGNIIVYQNLCQVSGLDYRNLKKHLEILIETFVCYEAPPFSRNRQKELSRNPKIYFLDMGFRNNLMENMNSLDKRSDAGAIIENTCFIRLGQLFEGVNRVSFWRTKAGAKVDFVLSHGEDVIPIEVKSGLTNAKLTRSFVSFVEIFKPRRAVVLTNNYWGMAERGKTQILFAPYYYL